MNIELTNEELQIILAGLGKLPAEISFNLIIKINEELRNRQLNQDK